jgi:flagellar hook-length control protein FliK
VAELSASPDVATPAVVQAAAAGTVPAATGDRGTADDAGTTASTTPAPAAAGVAAAAGAPSSGAGSSSQQGSGGGDAQSPAPVVPAGSPAPATPVTATAAVAAADGATGASAAQPVGAQVARQVAVLRGGPDGAHTMTLVLTPDTLGPVEVNVTLSKGTVDLTLRGAHEHGRAALLDALPDLRRDLESAGLNPSRLDVARDTGGSWLDRHAAQQQAAAGQQGFGDRGGQQDRAEGRSRPWAGAADTGGSGPTPISNRSTSSGVDVRV